MDCGVCGNGKARRTLTHPPKVLARVGELVRPSRGGTDSHYKKKDHKDKEGKVRAITTVYAPGAEAEKISDDVGHTPELVPPAVLAGKSRQRSESFQTSCGKTGEKAVLRGRDQLGGGRLGDLRVGAGKGEADALILDLRKPDDEFVGLVGMLARGDGQHRLLCGYEQLR